MMRWLGEEHHCGLAGPVVSWGGPGVLAEWGRGVMEASWLSVLRFLLWRFL